MHFNQTEACVESVKNESEAQAGSFVSQIDKVSAS